MVIGVKGKGQVPTQDLILHLKFDGGILADVSGLNHQVINHGTSFGQGVHEEGVVLDGTDDYLEVITSATLQVPNEVSMSLWYQHQPQASPNSFYSLIEQSADEDGGHSRYGIWLQGDRFWGCVEPDSCPDGVSLCQRCVDAPVNLLLNQWYHLACTYDGQSLKLFVDGVKILSQDFANSTGISTRPFPLTLGTDIYDPSPVYLKGQLDELRLYKAALSDVEIASLASEFTATGLANSLLPSQGLFPNPCQGMLNLPGNWASMRDLYLLDSKGRVLAELEARNQQVELGDIPPGVYLLWGRSDLRSLAQRIVIE